MIKKKQKGSLLVEMMAVIGLLTLITPILFQQVHRRNEEIITAQIATEMRMIKDGMTAYLEAYEDKIAQEYCEGLWDAEKGRYKYLTSGGKPVATECYAGNDPEIEGEFSKYLPATDVTGDILNEYQIRIYGYTLPTNCDTGGTCDYRPVLYALIVEGQSAYGNSLRRKAKIASLIGAEGGVVSFKSKDGLIEGMHGSWNIALDDVSLDKGEYGEYAAAVVTFFNNISSSTILKDVRWQHLDATTVQSELIAAERIAAKDLFTVDRSNNGCIRDFRKRSLTLYAHEADTSGGEDECDPFFEVNPETKEVRVKGRIMTGVRTTRFYCEQLRDKTTCTSVEGCTWDDGLSTCNGGVVEFSCSGQTQNTCNFIPGCSWVNNTCYGCADWTGTTKELCEEVYGRGCAWLDDKQQCVSEFMLDPTSTSVINRMTLTDDIIISGLNNRRLAAALPNEVLMSSELYCWITKKGGVIGVQCNNANGTNGAGNPTGGQAWCSGGANSGFTVAQFQRYNRNGSTPGGATCHSVFNYSIPHLTAAESADGVSIRQGCFRYCDNIARVIDPNYNAVMNHAPTDENGDGCTWYNGVSDASNPAYAFCSRNVSIHQACRNYCSSTFADEVFGAGGMTESVLRSHVLLVAERVCGLTYGKCTVKNLSNKLPCPDTRNYAYDIVPVISSVEGNLTAMPYRNYDTTHSEWEFYLGGATMINLQEYCRAHPESRSK
ncbi:MAG: hypothetical protein J6Y03_01290 [Alphaproteobacteria bacterium]|nr:hypothetical protein [Alphaproteobacteria bacterium]